MDFRPHIKLNTKKQHEKVVKLVFNYGNPNDDEDISKVSYPKNLAEVAIRFRGYLKNFKKDLDSRIQERNINIEVSDHFEYIKIVFQGQFNVEKYFQNWINDFGLMGVEFSKFNHEILFVNINEYKFQKFLLEIERFIENESGDDTSVNYSGKIRYIQSFELFSSQNMLKHGDHINLLNLKLIEFPLNDKRRDLHIDELKEYLSNNDIDFIYTESNIELYGATKHQALEISQNFDVVLSLTSGMATIVRPDILNLPDRSYGFKIENPEDSLPLIGILDTGISRLSPLAEITVNDHDFNLTESPVDEDNIDGGQGHGTGVAALAALGKQAYKQNYKGRITADAKLLSMKIMDDKSGYISHSKVLNLLIAAKVKYPDIKIFVLTICYEAHKLINENTSLYAFELDSFAHKNDCIISICTANNHAANISNATYNLSYFNEECTNICAPAESMNNIIVGAASHSLKTGTHIGVSTSLEFPTLYTRKSHINLNSLYPTTKINKRFFRPDVIEFGGDYEFTANGSFFGQGINASMDILSADPSESFYSNIGTSFSAPLVANAAAKIQRKYPEIRAQSIKALIINSASLEKIRFEGVNKHLLNKVAGHGLVNDNKCLNSTNNSITFLIEDEIEPEKLVVFPLNFPKYLTDDDLGKKMAILKVSATLCFSFNPVMDNQMVYCPIHMAFTFFKNHNPDQILSKSEDIDSLLKSDLSWSQNGRYKAKPIAPTNTQKLTFVVNRNELINEQGTFKVGVNCRILSQLLPSLTNSYNHMHPFSIAITIEENLPLAKLTGKLYKEMIAVNEIINIVNVEGHLEAEI